MNDVVKPEGDDTKVPEPDAFGMVETPTPPAGDTQKEEEKGGGEGDGKGKEGEKKTFDAIPEDHPTIVALKQQIEDTKSEYGNNLAGQREVIKGLEKKIETLTQGKEEEAAAEEDVLFKDIKRSSDLTKEEREGMTDLEIRQMDELADIKDAQNKMYAESRKKERDEERKSKEGDDQKVEDLNNTVKSIAKELAKEASEGKDNDALANEIIESAKQFNLQGLDEKTLRERITQAHKLLPSYTPPKEKPITPTGGSPAGGTDDKDPHGVDAIVEEATKGQDGTYDL